MNGSVTKFVAPTPVNPSDRVSEFIQLAQGLTDVLIADEDWQKVVWEVGKSFNTKGQNRSTRLFAFVNRDASISPSQVVVGEPLHPTFIDFAKAYCRYQHSASPVQFENQAKRLGALRLIEAAFRSFGRQPSIQALDVAIMNKAIELAKEGVGVARHYQFAIYIQQVHRFCMDRHFLNAPFQWKHGVRKPKDRTEEIGAEAKEWREKKLPSPEAFHALAYIFRTATSSIDRLFSAVCAICISIPIRAHEVLQLRIDCEVFGKTKSEETGEEIDTYGIRVWPGKNNPPQVKWVPTQMVDVVQQAVSRLREISAGPRTVARWYEEHPDVLWLPEEAERFRRSGMLPLSELIKIVRHPPNKNRPGHFSTAKWARQLGIENDGVSRRKPMKHVDIASMAEKLLTNLPADFPYFNGDAEQRYSQSLIVIYDNEFFAVPIPFVVTKVSVGHFNRWLGGHDNGKLPSVFKRWEMKEKDGSDIEITTHSFRHWLNTVAQFRGMSELDIAKWSGRGAAQSKAYNHVSPEEILSQIREALDDGTAIGPIFEAAKIQGVNRPVDRKEVIDAQIGSALLSDYGICVHDYSLLPCQSFGDCLGCSENVFVKGDQDHRAKIANRLVITEKQLDDALAAMGKKYFGADKWVESHCRSIERMQQMLAIHDDASIPDGTIVNLAEASHDNAVAMAIRDRRALGDEEDNIELGDDDDLADFMAMMGED
ncbi:hypothetical protein [Rhizobium ruizarguesonis]|uniref:hypothetical protein n=1 Tax=Rhizobium ruizarguesonis TaxID=2081791 RepID=UPI0013CAA25E|nr:hypothetical protein [Rhizobium ruizarguesonis]NEH27459.1 hypothetical protein [Rhizobium ruizarguesonis]